LIYVYEYDNSQGLQTGALVKRGQTGTAYYVSATDWGDGMTANEPLDRMVASYEYPTKTATRASGVATTYAYTFYDGAYTQLQSKTTTLPAVATTENGSNVQTVTKEYYDDEGRLRWAKDGEEYVDYYSYNPSTGGLAYSMTDVNTGSLPSDITSGSSGKWLAWSGGVPSGFTRGSLPTALALVDKREYDLQGREFLHIEPSGAKHYTAYETASNLDRVIRFPYWDSSISKTLLPVQVSQLDVEGRLASQYTLAPATPTLNGSSVPVALGSTLIAETPESKTRHLYDAFGRQTEIRRYHDTSGDTAFTNYYATHMLYDAEGRVGASIQDVASGKYQAQVQLFDVLGRPIETRIAVESSLQTAYLPLVDATPYSGYAATSKTIYDDVDLDGDSDIGDGNVTISRQYHTTSVYTDTIFYRTFRGFVRGFNKSYYSGSAADVKPYQARDVDWMGRTVEQAVYTTAPTWSSLTSGDGDSSFVPSSSPIDRQSTMYDALNRIYRAERYPGTATDKVQTNNYYDRRNLLVCTGDKHSAHSEYAYDGAGRRYTERKVTDAAATPYSSGVFQYRQTKPSPSLPTSSTTGDDGVLEMRLSLFDAAGNATAVYTAEINHTDTNGIDLDTPSSYTRMTVYNWYDGADRVVAGANYGAGQGDGSTDTWMNTSLLPPGRPSTALTWTDSAVYNGYVLLTTYGYDASTGRRDTVSVGVKKKTGSNDTDKMVTKTFYDDLGRRTFVAENYQDFSPASITSTAGGGTNNDQDRVTGWEYDGLSNVTKLTAYNLATSSDDQLTQYFYADSYHAGLVTKTVYPDGDTTNDNVQRTYNLDQSLATMTDQRGVVHEYSYNSRRQLENDGVTSLGSSGIVDGGVLSIYRVYDDRGRLTNVVSRDAATGGNWLNQVATQYWDAPLADVNGLPFISYQWHDGSTHKDVIYRWDSVAASGLFTNHLRQWETVYPNGAIVYRYFGSDTHPETNSDTFDDRLDLISALSYDKDGDGTTYSPVKQTAYTYNGTNRLVAADYVEPDVRRQMFDATTTANYLGFDQFGRTIKQQWHDYTSGTVVRDEVDYAYDYAGNRLSRDIPSTLYSTNDKDQLYAYDGLQRLASMDQGTLSGGTISSPPVTEDWSLDGLGNWNTFTRVNSTLGNRDETRTHNVANEMTDDEDNNIPLSNPGHDAAGNLTAPPMDTGGYPFTFKYDAWNRLAAVFSPIQSSTNPIAKYKYDGLKRRIVKELDDKIPCHDVCKC
jgi:hypothetical protein